MHLARVGVTLALALSSAAYAGPFRDRLAETTAAVDRAMAEAARTTPRCRTAVQPETMRARDIVTALNRRSTELELADAQLTLAEATLTAMKIRCSERVVKGLADASVALRAARDLVRQQSDRAWAEYDDHRGPGHGPGHPGGPGGPGGLDRRVTANFLGPVRIEVRSQLRNVPGRDGQPAVEIIPPALEVRRLRGADVYVAAAVRADNGNWLPWMVAPTFKVDRDEYQTMTPLYVDHQTLRGIDTARGRFVAAVAVFRAGGQEELARVELPFTADVQMRDCGTGTNDPGCTMMRFGRLPMDRAQFDALMANLRNNSSELARAQAVQTAVASGAMITALQLEQILEQFRAELNKIEVASQLAAKLVNPVHAQRLSSKFRRPEHQDTFSRALAGQQ